MPILGYDYIEFYVGNAKQAAHYYGSIFGFSATGYAGPETGVRDRASYVMEQNDIRFVFTAGLSPDSEINRHQFQHGDGVKDVAFRVPDAEDAFRTAVRHGATPHREPTVHEDEGGKIVTASIKAYGDTIHTFVDRSNYSGPYLPGYKPTRHWQAAQSTGLRLIDHVVCNVELGTMDEWAAYYANIMGFSQLHHFNDEQISTEYTALMSKVLWDGEGRIKLPINEPADGKKKSQIEEYPGLLPQPRRPAHGPRHRRHRRHGQRHARQRGPLPGGARHLLRRPERSSTGPRSTPTSTAGRAGHPGRPGRRGLPAPALHQERSRTGRRCSSRSSSATGPAASA
jgi:4-hydroxyphenylpyruvate dioxygenase-like putative hemolysin